MNRVELNTAIVLVAHGSQEQGANTDAHHVAAQIRARGRYGMVEACFLELAEPTVRAATDLCIKKGAKRIILLPYFLSAGVHVSRDLAAIQQELSERNPGVRFILAEPLGRHPLLVEIVLERATSAE